LKFEELVSKVALRAGLTWQVWQGGFDQTVDLAKSLGKVQERCDKLVDIVRGLEYDRAYFLALWKKAGREHAAAQGYLIDRIDELRQRLGEASERETYLAMLEDYSKKNIDVKHPFDSKQFPRAPEIPTEPIALP
jgi:hypothetical protein